MKAFVVVPGDTTYLVTLKEKVVAKGERAQRRALLGENVQRAVDVVSASTHWPRWFAENVVRWRARHGYVLVGAQK